MSTRKPQSPPPAPFPVRQGSGKFPPLVANSLVVATRLLREAGWLPFEWDKVYPGESPEEAHASGARAFRQGSLTLTFDPRRPIHPWTLHVAPVQGRSWVHLVQQHPWGPDSPSVAGLLSLPAAAWDYADDAQVHERLRLAGYEVVPSAVEGITQWRGCLPGTGQMVQIVQDRPADDPQCPLQGYWELHCLVLDKRTLEVRGFPLAESRKGLGPFMSMSYSGRVGDLVVTDATVGVMLGVV